ncbi:hypothetical protein IC627_22145 (plasmid) [Photobacterium damselae subsp. piscicida]|uniref:Uncharacterized protein n=1 Tax=Photobacterium damsela subsp. piscicida TaxID=38294 RepID=A0A1V1VGH4_PHODP|nr:hypothetical protein [Photobacterium damselae]MBE8130628.1 hypothetical protein [Photobacterium damselae subsp. piscicida]MDP2531490.1 hypothetical protein [Photobacterium damselae subsp. piscicida]QOD55074.1 hypothetical protein IC628_22035 [Photobacterium damselae subsp. piscicida]QOD58900.1 hypothetical protein IC627_22145 [Photobacterium damselae subsp. piscicida]GAW47255.1 hypothetical protein PDPJ_3_00076 [Photobacterium damselae subsp. piscicida]
MSAYNFYPDELRFTPVRVVRCRVAHAPSLKVEVQRLVTEPARFPNLAYANASAMYQQRVHQVMANILKVLLDGFEGHDFEAIYRELCQCYGCRAQRAAVKEHIHRIQTKGYLTPDFYLTRRFDEDFKVEAYYVH